jgi:hypothetical protein
MGHTFGRLFLERPDSLDSLSNRWRYARLNASLSMVLRTRLLPRRRPSLRPRSRFHSALQDLIPRCETSQRFCRSWAFLPAEKGPICCRWRSVLPPVIRPAWAARAGTDQPASGELKSRGRIAGAISAGSWWPAPPHSSRSGTPKRHQWAGTGSRPNFPNLTRLPCFLLSWSVTTMRNQSLLARGSVSTVNGSWTLIMVVVRG